MYVSRLYGHPVECSITDWHKKLPLGFEVLSAENNIHDINCIFYLNWPSVLQLSEYC
jgi:hypothetical protein